MLFNSSKIIYRYWCTLLVFVLLVASRVYGMALAPYQIQGLPLEEHHTFSLKANQEYRIHFSTCKDVEYTDFVFINEVYDEESEEEEDSSEEKTIGEDFIKFDCSFSGAIIFSRGQNTALSTSRYYHSKSHQGQAQPPLFILYSQYRI